MSNDLQNSLNLILAEKTNKIVPENIRAGVTIYNVTGNYVPPSAKPDVMLFDSMENMMDYHNADIGDYATVYANSSAHITATTQFSSCTFPNIVVLPSAFSNYANCMFRSTDGGYFDGYVDLSSSSFMFDGWGDTSISIQYTSSDGITYTRTDGGSEQVNFGTTIQCDSGSVWNDVIGYFMLVSSTDFEGLFQYTVNNLYEMAPTQLTAITNSVVSASFLGQNGVEVGNLQNPNITSLDELKEKVQVYSDLSYLGLNENITNMSFMFRECSNLTSVPNFDTSNVTNMLEMFGGCNNLITVPNFNTSNVTDMKNMFFDCRNLTSVHNFNTINVTTMNAMFYGCTNLTSVPNLDTSSAVDTSYMFYNCFNIISAPNFNTSKVTTMYSMFNNCCNLITVPTFNTSKVITMPYMFSGCNNLSDASIQNIINMCLNSNVTATSKNLSNTYYASPFLNTNISNTRYQNRWAELTAAGWTY